MGQKKFTLLKGCEGFGDRLQCLLQAIEYSEVTGRTLVVDWRDEHWCHEDGKGFDNYFEIEGMETMKIEDFIKVFRERGMECMPAPWGESWHHKNEISKCYKREYMEEGKNETWRKIINGEQKDFGEEIVIHTGTGARSCNADYCRRLRLKEYIIREIRTHARQKLINKGEYACMHLRGGSKHFCGARTNNMKAHIEMIKKWPTLTSYLDYLEKKFRETSEISDENRLLIVSDVEKLAESMKRRYSHAEIIKHSCSSYFEETGVHMIRENIGVAKEKIIKETIRDFNLMLNSKVIISDGSSLYSNMAKRIQRKGITLVELPENTKNQK